MNLKKKQPQIPSGLRKEQEFLKLAEKFRGAEDPKVAKLLGEELGKMVFGGGGHKRRPPRKAAAT